MSQTFIRHPKYSRKQWAVLLFCLKVSALLVCVPLFWLFYKMRLNWGDDIAHIILAFVSFGLLVVVLMGAGIGLAIDYAIRRRKFIFRDPQPGSRIYGMVRVWGYDILETQASELEPPPPDTKTLPDLPDEPYTLPEKARRKGRKPQFNVKDWAKVALKWEQRDPTFDLFTLEQVICQELGKHPNGAPIMSEKAYRGTWRIRAIRYINQHGLAKKPLSED
jgi:hypothetical protein